MKKLPLPWILAGAALIAAIAACSSDIKIGPDGKVTTSSTTIGSTTSSSTSSSSTSGFPTTTTPTGAGVTTADSDITQAQSITVTGGGTSGNVTVLEGPFYVTDVFAGGAYNFTTIHGTDCSAPPEMHTSVLQPISTGSNVAQIHGIRLPVLATQSLCIQSFGTPIGSVTVLGFRPY